MKISEAVYRRGNVEEVIQFSLLNKSLYYSKYRGYLFCPEQGCNALLCYVERKKNDSSFFRTWSKKEHKKGCPYEVNYDNADDETHRVARGQLINLTNKHIKEKLMRTYEQMLGNGNPLKKPVVKLTRRKIYGRLEDPKGEPALFNKGGDFDSGREPYILTRRYDKLDELDVEKIRCVFGEIKSMVVLGKHAYINLTPNVKKSVKIYFSEYFRAENGPQFQNLHLLKNYIDRLKKTNSKIICCCIGRITKVSNGFNIHPDRYNGFIINGLGFYDLIRS